MKIFIWIILCLSILLCFGSDEDNIGTGIIASASLLSLVLLKLLEF